MRKTRNTQVSNNAAKSSKSLTISNRLRICALEWIDADEAARPYYECVERLDDDWSWSDEQIARMTKAEILRVWENARKAAAMVTEEVRAIVNHAYTKEQALDRAFCEECGPEIDLDDVIAYVKEERERKHKAAEKREAARKNATSEDLALAYAKIQAYATYNGVKQLNIYEDVSPTDPDCEYAWIERVDGVSDRKWNAIGLSLRSAMNMLGGEHWLNDNGRQIVIPIKAYRAAKRAFKKHPIVWEAKK